MGDPKSMNGLQAKQQLEARIQVPGQEQMHSYTDRRVEHIAKNQCCKEAVASMGVSIYAVAWSRHPEVCTGQVDNLML